MLVIEVNIFWGKFVFSVGYLNFFLFCGVVEFVCDDDLLDLCGVFVEVENVCVMEKLFNVIIRDVICVFKYLYGVIGDLFNCF